ncbi:MAG: UDP-N-acetylmuramoyl-L-alanine--D-glutamate ligase, partial [Bacteroidetes bacterium]|nr:UDP-N-acetylmuramoyl-L-alanine--D-glutamate ligase [Bacteroidota bacterium]
MAKKVAILGAGESGVGAAILAQKKGFEVLVSDKGTIKEKYKNVLSQHNIRWEEGKHSEEEILSADEVIKSPGIPEKAELVKKLKAKNIPVVSEIEFAGRYTNAKTICITGSNGKTTTTMLIYHILANAGLNVKLGGNIGQSYAKQVAEEEQGDELLYYVLELSSFQLDGMFEFRADIAILLNITPDHLDRYEYDMQKYINSKFRIIQNQTEEDVFIYFLDDENIMNEVKKREIKARQFYFSLEETVGQGAFLKENNLIFNINEPFTMSINDLAFQGKHNLCNSMAAGVTARLLEIRKENIRDSFSDFQNVEHRLEYVAKVNGMEFINDSKATNVNSTWYALESMENPTIWIAGGVDKGNDYSSMADIARDKVKVLICLGTDNEKLINAFKNVIPVIEEAKSAQEAVAIAYRLGRKGDTVLLSPACASFDLFHDYEDRGRQFK